MVHTPRVAISLVSSVAPILSTAQQKDVYEKKKKKEEEEVKGAKEETLVTERENHGERRHPIKSSWNTVEKRRDVKDCVGFSKGVATAAAPAAPVKWSVI